MLSKCRALLGPTLCCWRKAKQKSEWGPPKLEANCQKARHAHNQRETKGGGELRGAENIPSSPSPKTVLDPPLMIRFPPPLCSRPVILLRGNGHRPDKSHFLRPPKLVLEGALYSTFPLPPPPKVARYVLPPPLCEFPTQLQTIFVHELQRVALPQKPCHTRTTTAILVHQGGSKKLRR